jgi:hypothetical protein
VLAHHLAILIREDFRDDRHLFAALQVLEAGGVRVGKRNLGGIEHVEHDQIVAERAVRLERFHQVRRVLVEIGNQHDDGTAFEMFGEPVEHRDQPARLFRAGSIERVQQHVEVLGRRRHVRNDVLVERDDADTIPLAVREIGQRRRQERGVLQLADLPAREPHGLGDVEHDHEVGVGVRLVLLDVVAIGTGVQLPVDPADVIARHVPAVLGKVHGRAEERRAVQAVDEPVDDIAREELEILDPREDLRIDEPRARKRVRLH